VGAALGARPLLDQHELAALEIDPGPGEHGQHLEGEEDLAVEVLVQRVPVALAVAQDQRRRALLAGGAAAGQQRLVRGRVALLLAQPLGPLVGDRREAAVEAVAQLGDRPRQRVVEVAVAAVAEAVTGHLDGRPEPAVVEEAGEPGALGLAEQPLGDGEAAAVELGGQLAPVERLDPAPQRSRRGDVHRSFSLRRWSGGRTPSGAGT
jgi:hypothetical protein